ncbi:MAG: hypothetical protein SFY92_02460 [Verrucomicrobiae bacterium]|nr:hypothetical protein [Verrucomicrobiae bacterium]
MTQKRTSLLFIIPVCLGIIAGFAMFPIVTTLIRDARVDSATAAAEDDAEAPHWYAAIQNFFSRKTYAEKTAEKRLEILNKATLGAQAKLYPTNGMTISNAIILAAADLSAKPVRPSPENVTNAAPSLIVPPKPAEVKP